MHELYEELLALLRKHNAWITTERDNSTDSYVVSLRIDDKKGWHKSIEQSTFE